GALNDWLTVDDEPALAPDTFLDYRFEADGVVSYLNALLPELRVDKRVSLTPAGLQVEYELRNLADRPRRVRWRLASELAPDYTAALSGGRSTLVLDPPAGGALAVRNTRTGAALALTPSRPWTAYGLAEHLLGLELWAAFEIDLAPLAGEVITLTLSVTPAAAP
ncbi:MAG: hypothetical protein JNK29_20400, partial [Anaerolineales bacterium]|nr:hypothetical protein [Anaerolineales bacterium]